MIGVRPAGHRDTAHPVSTFRALEHQGWSHRAAGYGDCTARGTTQTVPALLNAVRARWGIGLLDLCTGPGYAAAAAAALGVRTLGTDFSARMIDQARARFPHLTFETGDAEAIAKPDACFDAVTCNFGVFHLARPEASFVEALRVLRPGGWYAFSQWLGPQQSVVQGLIAGALADHADLSRVPPAPDAYRYSDPEACRDALARAGFEAIEIHRVDAVIETEAESFFDFFAQFAVRAPMAVAMQDAGIAARIRAQIDRGAEAYRRGRRLVLPSPALIAAGRAPL